MFFLHGELIEESVTLLFLGTLTEEGGSGRSQVGGIPALSVVVGRVLLMRLAILMIIIQLLSIQQSLM